MLVAALASDVPSHTPSCLRVLGNSFNVAWLWLQLKPNELHLRTCRPAMLQCDSLPALSSAELQQ